MFDSTSLLYFVLLIICVGASAFFSSAETAFVSLPKTRLTFMVSKGVGGAERVAHIMEQPERLLATVLLCNNFVNVAAAALGTTLAVSIWEGDVGVLIATIVVTIVLLVFAEVTPKTVAMRHPERLALVYVYPLIAITKVVYPLAAALSWIGSLLAGGKARVPKELVSEEEIRSMITVGREEGTVEEAEAEMLHKVFEFGDRSVREVMTPRPEVAWVEEGTKLADFLDTYAESPHTRFPVYRDNIDDVVGILSIKDVLMAQAKASLGQDSAIGPLVRPIEFVPETKPIGQLFGEMRSRGYNMAVVVDEFGVTSGIATMEQLAGEIVGHLGDELLGDVKDFTFIDEQTIQIDGSMRVEDANEELGLGLPEGEYDTVAGFVLSLLGYIPKEGEQLKYNGLKLVITEMRGLKVEKILVTKE
ncbi:MAG: hemolysin family protein [Chloroflexota bacterium]|nr:hemolysin family protein [Chloroflexota bacterium]